MTQGKLTIGLGTMYGTISKSKFTFGNFYVHNRQETDNLYADKIV